MKKRTHQHKIVSGLATATLSFGLLACSPAPSAESDSAAEPVASSAQPAENGSGLLSMFDSEPVTHTVEAGTPIVVRTTSTLSTKSNATGETFAASLEQPLVINGVTVAEKGTRVTGRVASADPGGRVKGIAQIGVALEDITINGQNYPVVSGVYVQSAKKTVKKDAKKVGIGAGIGAAIGAVAGGGDGALKGAGIGAGAGTAAVLGTRGDAAVIPAETVLTFSLAEPITVQAD